MSVYNSFNAKKYQNSVIQTHQARPHLATIVPILTQTTVSSPINRTTKPLTIPSIEQQECRSETEATVCPSSGSNQITPPPSRWLRSSMRNESIDNGWGPSENEANQRPFGEMSSSLRGCWQPCMPDDDGESVTIDREIRDTCVLIDILTHTPDTPPLHNSYHRQQPCGQGRRPEKWVTERACISNPSPSFRHLHHSRQQHAAKLPTTTEQRWNSRY